MSYGYDPNVDYQKLINEAVANNDYRSAAIYEAQRNEKIQGEGATQYQTTDHYSAYLPQAEQINQGLDAYGQAAFHYDPQEDPVFQAYRSQYLREADRQTRDTMGAYAGMTGGVPSSAAVTAAQQAGNYQRSKLTDMIPQLYQAAYGRFADEQARQLQGLELRANIEEQRVQDSMAAQQQALQAQQLADDQQQQEISRALQQWTTLGYADAYVASVLGVPVGTQTSDASYQQWTQQQSELQAAREYALAILQTGKLPTADVLAAAGISQADAQNMANYYAQQNLKTGRSGGYSSGGYSSGGGGGGGGAGSGSYSYEELAAIGQDLAGNGLTLQQYSALLQTSGLSRAQMEALWTAAGGTVNNGDPEKPAGGTVNNGNTGGSASAGYNQVATSLSLYGRGWTAAEREQFILEALDAGKINQSEAERLLGWYGAGNG